MATRDGSAQWDGNLEDGSGRVSVAGGAWEGEYTAASRFEEGDGTNPEELIAAAHAACFSMALANIAAGEGHEPRSVKTTAKVHMRFIDDAPTIARIELETEGDIEGVDEAGFRDLAEKAKAGCPVSRALGGVNEIEVSARLAS